MFVNTAFGKVIRKWQSNSEENEKISSANEENKRDLMERSNAQGILTKIQKCDLKVLGISWNKETDQFNFRSKNAGEVTKQEFLWF